MWNIFMNATAVCGMADGQWSPTFAHASTMFVRGIINAHTWLVWITLPNSDNLALGECVLNNLYGFAT